MLRLGWRLGGEVDALVEGYPDWNDTRRLEGSLAGRITRWKDTHRLERRSRKPPQGPRVMVERQGQIPRT